MENTYRKIKKINILFLIYTEEKGIEADKSQTSDLAFQILENDKISIGGSHFLKRIILFYFIYVSINFKIFNYKEITGLVFMGKNICLNTSLSFSSSIKRKR